MDCHVRFARSQAAKRVGRLQALRVALVMIVLSTTTATAHKAPLPLAFWGFDMDCPDCPQCQRLIGNAAAACAGRAWAVRSACLGAQIAGGSCDTQAADDAVNQAHLDALNSLDNGCPPQDLQPLGFFLGIELDTDVDTACRVVENAFVSAIYGPVLRRAPVGGVNPATQTCVKLTAGAASQILSYAFRVRRRALDRIATKPMGPGRKDLLVARSGVLIQRALDVLGRGIATSCSDADFRAIYQRDIATLLSGIAAHVDCLGGAGYVQDAVVCPMPVCGNGFQETGEQCDDGNTIAGDGCNGKCVTEPVH